METFIRKDNIKKEPGCIDEIKREYNKYKETYNLPDFSLINKDFDIEDIDINTEFLLRRIRRYMSEKIAGYMRFIEVILNPSNAPMFFFKLIKKIDNNDREKLLGIYETLGKIEIETLILDLEYNEKKEAEYLLKIYNDFNNNLRKDLLLIIKKLDNGEGIVNKNNSNGSYFG